jgi:uncharacterized protein involved in exopolysaccharide biosynthesis
MCLEITFMTPASLASDDSAITVREAMSILFLRKWSIFVIFSSIVGVAACMTFYVLSPAYESQAVIVIYPGNPSLPLVELTAVTDFEKLTAFHTQKDIIGSAAMATQVVDKLRLDQHRVLSNLERLRIWVRGVRRQVGFALDIRGWQKPDDPRADAIAALVTNLQIVTRPDSQALKLTYRARAPQEAADTLRTWLDLYIEYHTGRIRERAGGAMQYIQAEMGNVESKLAAAETSLLHFKESDTMLLEGRREHSPPGSARINSRVGPPSPAAGARAVDPPAPASSPREILGVTDSPAVQNEIKAYILSMEEDLRKLRVRFGENYPAIIELREKIARYVSALNELPKKELNLMRLRRDLEIKQEEFLTLKRALEKAKLIAAGNAVQIGLITVVEPPQADDTQVSPKPRLTMALAVVFGLVFSVVCAVFLHYIDHSFRSARDIRRYLGVPLLDSLPRL